MKNQIMDLLNIASRAQIHEFSMKVIRENTYLISQEF